MRHDDPYQAPAKTWRERIWRLMKRTDAFLILLSVLVCALMLLRYAPITPQPIITCEPVQLAAPPAHLAESARQPLTDEGKTSATKPQPPGPPIVFLMHNVANYFVDGETRRSRYEVSAKRYAAREAVADVIASARPEIVGLAEIGGPLALKDLRMRLAERSLEYPYYLVLSRNGEDRALAVLSRHPIVCNNSQADYALFGAPDMLLLRGILDVTVQVADGRLFRIIGAHLKSRVSQDPEAAESLRRREAQTIARYLHRMMLQQPDMPILLYGDWNDGPADESVTVLRQGISKETAMKRLKPVDSRGECWTLFHDDGFEYSTFDHIYINKVLQKRIGSKQRCGIVDVAKSSEASDHRAIWVELR